MYSDVITQMELALSLAIDAAKNATTFDELTEADNDCLAALEALIDAIQIDKGFDDDLD